MFPIMVTMHLLATALCSAVAIVCVQVRRRQRIAVLVVEDARRSASEYDRARHDYEQLIRHRIANPLAVVQGVALTLQDHPDLPAATRSALVESLVAAADDLVEMSLDPAHRSPAERDLHAEPRLAPRPAASSPSMPVAV